MRLHALGVLDEMIDETAALANQMAVEVRGFDAIGAGAGVGIRLKALSDARAAIVIDALQRHEGKPDS